MLALRQRELFPMCAPPRFNLNVRTVLGGESWNSTRRQHHKTRLAGDRAAALDIMNEPEATCSRAFLNERLKIFSTRDAPPPAAIDRDWLGSISSGDLDSKPARRRATHRGRRLRPRSQDRPERFCGALTSRRLIPAKRSRHVYQAGCVVDAVRPRAAHHAPVVAADKRYPPSLSLIPQADWAANTTMTSLKDVLGAPTPGSYCEKPLQRAAVMRTARFLRTCGRLLEHARICSTQRSAVIGCSCGGGRAVWSSAARLYLGGIAGLGR